LTQFHGYFLEELEIMNLKREEEEEIVFEA
jgi:hypothetical protein